MYKKPASDNERGANALIDIKIFEFSTSLSGAFDNEIDVLALSNRQCAPNYFSIDFKSHQTTSAAQ